VSIAGSAPPRHRRSLFDALFGEAWTLERRRRKRYLALAVLVCLAVGTVITLTNGDRSFPAPVASTEPVGLRAVGAVNVSGPQALLANAGSLWIATPSSVVRLNLRSGSKLGRIPMPTNGVNAGLASGAGSIWLAPTGASRLLRIDPSNNRLVANIPLGVNHRGRLSSLGGGVAFAAGRIWVSRVSNGPRGDVVSVNPATNRETATPVAVGSGPETVVSAFGSLWVDNTSVVIGKNAPSQIYPAVSRIDPRTRHVTTEWFSGTPATGFGSVWVETDAGSDDAAIIRVNPANGKTLAQIDVPRVISVSSGGGRLWAISYPRSRSARLFEPIKDTAALWQINPRTNHVVGRRVRLPLTEPISIVVSHRQLWIADYQSGKVIHFELIKH
jgi:hypothetical protein